MKTLAARRWMVFFLATLLFLLSQFYRVSMAVVVPSLTAEVPLEPRRLGTISAAFFYAFALMQLPIGIYLDRFGPRRTMAALTLVAGAGALVFAQGQTFASLVAGRALLGIGMACNLMGTLKLITLWFGPAHFATLSALVVSLGTVGNLAAATPLVLLVEAAGWRDSFRLLGLLTAALAVIFYLAVRDHPDCGPTYGSLPDLQAVPAASTSGALGALFAQRDYWIISFGTFCRYGIYAAVQALWAGPFLMAALGVSALGTGNLLFVMSIGMVVGCPFCGWLSDDLLRSRKIVIVGGLGGMVIVLAILAHLSPGTATGMLVGLFFAFGFFSGAGQIMYAQIKEHMPLAQAGTAMTGINFFTMLGVAFFLQGMGSLLQRLNPEAAMGLAAFRTAFLFCAGCLSLAAFFYLFTRETLGRRRGPGSGGR
jgi:sugar phosphate permease